MSTTAKANKFKGTCKCGTSVAAGAGFLGPKVNGSWTVRCAAELVTARPARRPVLVQDTGEACDAVFDRNLVATGSRRGW